MAKTLSKLWFSPMITMTCLIGVLVEPCDRGMAEAVPCAAATEPAASVAAAISSAGLAMPVFMKSSFR